LQQSLIVCGPEGIGKTTLLKTFENGHKDIWPICFVQGSSALSFESVVSQLSRFLNLSNASISFDLTALRAFCSKQKAVLVIDDADVLMPGLLGELMDFADALSGLRLVFAMNNDVLQAKTAAETALNNCHFIEIPPLNQRQCLEYLQNLSAQPGSPISFNAVTDSLVEAMYRKTMGVPGNIVAEFPKLKPSQGEQTRKLGLWLGVAGIVAALGFAVHALLPSDVFDGQSPEKTPNVLPVVNQMPITSPPAVTAEQTLPADENLIPANELLPVPDVPHTLAAQPDILETPKDVKPALNNLPATTLLSAPVEKAVEPGQNAGPTEVISGSKIQFVPQTVVAPLSEAAPAALLKSAENKPVDRQHSDVTPVTETAVIEKPVPVKPVNSKHDHATGTEVGDHEWIMAQPGNNYTVQVMVLSSKDSVNRYLRKHAELRSELKFYPIGKDGQEKYAIIYGSFATPIEALNQKSDMPAEFSNGLVKRMKQVQRENRKN
jgi:DamX protein